MNLFSKDVVVEVSMFDITSLVSRLSYLNLEKNVEKELMVAYYEGHYKGKLTGVMDGFVVVSDKPNLLSYLLEQGIICCDENMINKNGRVRIKEKKRVV